MSLLDRLRAWWRRLRERAGPASEVAGTDRGADPEADYECAVCGTDVEVPEGSCPLCRSTDVVPAGATAGGDGSSGDGSFDAGEPPAGDRHVSLGEDGSVERLRDLRADGELLERYADRWQSVEGGFRVETEDGTRVVDSREEVAAVLRAAAG